MELGADYLERVTFWEDIMLRHNFTFNLNWMKIIAEEKTSSFLYYWNITFEYERICPCSFLGQRSYYFTAPPGALCADWSFPHIRQVGLCRTVLLGTNNNYGGTTRRPDYPNGCYLERGRPLGFLNTHAGSRTFSGMQWCGLRDKGKRYVYFLANNYANGL